jgi:hypothetical protein
MVLESPDLRAAFVFLPLSLRSSCDQRPGNVQISRALTSRELLAELRGEASFSGRP